MFVALAHTPAFNSALLVETANGGRIPRVTEAMYDRADYRYQVALEWYYRSMFAAVRDTARPGKTQPDAPDMARRARALVREALRQNPAHAPSWLLVAKTEAALGQPDAALGALRISTDLAPHSALFALERLNFLTQLVSRPDARALVLATVDPRSVRTDLAALRTNAAMRSSTQRLSRNPAILAILDETAASD